MFFDEDTEALFYNMRWDIDAHIAGGAVRDFVFGKPVRDIDVFFPFPYAIPRHETVRVWKKPSGILTLVNETTTKVAGDLVGTWKRCINTSYLYGKDRGLVVFKPLKVSSSYRNVELIFPQCNGTMEDYPSYVKEFDCDLSKFWIVRGKMDGSLMDFDPNEIHFSGNERLVQNKILAFSCRASARYKQKIILKYPDWLVMVRAYP